MASTEKASVHRVDILAWLLIAVFGIVAATSLNESMFYSPDSANYLGWAASLASFDGFTLKYGPEPVRYVTNAPLYPVLLSPVARFFPMSVIAAKALTLGFGVLLLLLFYRFASARAGTNAAFVGLLVLVVNPEMMLFSTQILSDVPFAACLMVVLIVVNRLTREDPPPGWVFWSLPALLACAIHLRVIGLALLAAVVLFFALRKEYARAGFTLLIPLLVYLLWYVRNDVMVARTELPPLQNSKLFLSHFLTGNGGSLFTEFVSRARNNISFYAEPAGAMLFISQYVGWLFAVVDFRDPQLAAVQSIATMIQWPIVIGTLLLFAHGLYSLRKTDPTIRLIALFLIFYAGIVLFYPISDTRYLFPGLVVMAYGLAGSARKMMEWLQTRHGKSRYTLSIGFGLCFLLLLYPNFVWSANFIRTTAAFRNSPERLNAEIGKQRRYPLEYTKLFPQADAWITRQGIPSGVVLSRYVETAIWIPGWKVFVPEPFIAPGDFDMFVRDYGCRYIVAHMASHQLPDFEFQMAVSSLFRFKPVYRAGDVEVLQVYPRDDSTDLASSPDSPGDSNGVMRQELRRGIQLMQRGDDASALSAFERLRRVDGYEETGTFYAAVATEFCLRLDDARKLFREVLSMPVASTLLRQAQTHQNIIDLLESAMNAPSAPERASFYHTVSLSYWLLGFRPQAETMMRNCMAADSTYYIGPVFASLYALQRSDIAAAETSAERAKLLRPEEPLSNSLLSLVTIARERRDASLPPRKASLDIAMGKAFMSMGLDDFAIGPLAEATHLDTSNTEALQLLSRLYLLKHRMFPAQKVLKRLIQMEPSNNEARNRLKEISTQVSD